MADQTNRAKIYKLYLLGRTVEEVAMECKLSHINVSKYFVEFRIFQAQIDANFSTNRLSQIKTIEAELFEHLAKRKVDPVAWERKYKDLSITYSNYLVK